MRKMIELLKQEVPEVEIGNFTRPSNELLG